MSWRNPVQLPEPTERHSEPSKGAHSPDSPDNAAHFVCLLIQFQWTGRNRRERILFLQEFITDAYEFPDDSGLIFPDTQPGWRTGCRGDPDNWHGFRATKPLRLLISDALETKEARFFRGSSAAEVFQHHLQG